MSLTDLGRYLTGVLTVEASGPAVERFINLCITRGISLRDIHWRQGHIQVRMAVRDFFRLRPLARQTHTRLRVRRRWGWPFLWHRISRRRVLLAGALVFAAAAYAAAQFVWFVEIRGTRELEPALVREAAAALGLHPGVYRPGLDVEALERSLRAQLGATTAVLVRFVGTRAIIQVVERTLPPADRGQHDPADLVALRPGRVRTLAVYMGLPEVREGELVEAGQVLVRGLLVPGVGRGALELRPDQATPVRARGMVKAETWRDVYVEVPLVQQVRRPNGERVTRYELKWGRRGIIIPGRSVDKGSYQVSRRVWPLVTGRILGGPVEWVETTFTGMDVEPARLSPEQAAQAAQAAVVDAVRQGLAPRAEVQGVSRQVVWQTAQGTGIRFLVTVQEDIAVPRPAEALPPPTPPATP
ncbi:MAG: sporulation protein YqfD [Bacillota bacterium]